MVAYAKTITVAINLFGVAPSDKWNQHNWNSFLWGEGTNDLPVTVGKLIRESITLTNTVSPAAGFVRTFSVSISPTSETTREYLRDSAGYYHVFPDQVTDAEQREFTTWTSGTNQTTTWAQSSTTTTTWS